MYYIGIDVSTKQSALCILDGNGKSCARLSCRRIPSEVDPDRETAGAVF